MTLADGAGEHGLETGVADVLRLAQRGDSDARQRVLSAYARYLVTLARPQVYRRLRGKLDASDIAQEALLEAHRSFEQFRGQSPVEFAGWLRSILAHQVARHVRRHVRLRAGDVSVEQFVTREMDDSSAILDSAFVDKEDSPCGKAMAHEAALQLARQLESLPDDYREVIMLRHFDRLSFAQVAEQMQRSVDSVEKLWTRALAQLRRKLKMSAE